MQRGQAEHDWSLCDFLVAGGAADRTTVSVARRPPVLDSQWDSTLHHAADDKTANFIFLFLLLAWFVKVL